MPICIPGATPSIGSLIAAGNVVLGTTSSATNLTVRGDNTSFAFYGTLGQSSNAFPASLTKVCSERWTWRA